MTRHVLLLPFVFPRHCSQGIMAIEKVDLRTSKYVIVSPYDFSYLFEAEEIKSKADLGSLAGSLNHCPWFFIDFGHGFFFLAMTHDYDFSYDQKIFRPIYSSMHKSENA